MARFEFRLPDIGEGIAEAEIVAWHVQPGDRVVEDQGVADMMTDKATVEMESPVSGTVLEVAGAVAATLASYLVALKLYRAGRNHPLLLPVVTGTLGTVATLPPNVPVPLKKPRTFRFPTPSSATA